MKISDLSYVKVTSETIVGGTNPPKPPTIIVKPAGVTAATTNGGSALGGLLASVVTNGNSTGSDNSRSFAFVRDGLLGLTAFTRNRTDKQGQATNSTVASAVSLGIRNPAVASGGGSSSVTIA